jgi:hypothetical protein
MSMFRHAFGLGRTEAERLTAIMRRYDEERDALARAKCAEMRDCWMKPEYGIRWAPPNRFDRPRTTELPDERLKKISGVVLPAPDYRLFLVNEGDHYLAPVGLYTGGFEGTGDRLVETSRTSRYLGVLPQGGSVLIEELDIGILDFVLWYHFDLGFADGVDLKAWFQIGKAYALRDLRYSPALEKDGYYFPLKPRSKEAT